MEFITKDITAAMLDQNPVDTQMGRANLVEYNTTEDTIVWLDRKGTTIQMVPPAPRGAPGEAIGGSDRDAVPFRLLSYPLTEHVSVDAVRGKRRFGTVNEMETFQEKVNEKLAIGNVARCEIGGRGLKRHEDDLIAAGLGVARCEIGGRGLKRLVPLLRLPESDVARCEIGGRGLKLR